MDAESTLSVVNCRTYENDAAVALVRFTTFLILYTHGAECDCRGLVCMDVSPNGYARSHVIVLIFFYDRGGWLLLDEEHERRPHMVDDLITDCLHMCRYITTAVLLRCPQSARLQPTTVSTGHKYSYACSGIYLTWLLADFPQRPARGLKTHRANGSHEPQKQNPTLKSHQSVVKKHPVYSSAVVQSSNV